MHQETLNYVSRQEPCLIESMPGEMVWSNAVGIRVLRVHPTSTHNPLYEKTLCRVENAASSLAVHDSMHTWLNLKTPVSTSI